MNQTSIVRWAKQEFGNLETGDRRRRARTIALAAAVAQAPSGHITQVVSTPAEQEGAFRWVRNQAIEESSLVTSAASATAARCASHPFVFVALDQTTVKLVDRKREKGFGHVGRGGLSRRCRGLQAMTALAVTPSGTALGLLGQAWWKRKEMTAPHGPRDTRPVHQRESGMWTDCMRQTLVNMAAFDGNTSRPWFQLDRGGDAFHVLRYALDENLLLTVRSSSDRRLIGHDRKNIRKFMTGQKRQGFISLDLGKRRAKRMGRSSRRPVKFAITFVKTRLLVNDPLAKEKFEMPVTIVRAREHRPPANQDRIEWQLLTTYPVESFSDAVLVVSGYTHRWRVEEFHKTWKTGACKIESSQLRSRANFQRWATLLAIVATRIERLKFLARNEPETPAINELTRDEIDAAIIRTKTKKHKRGDDLNIQEAVHLVALVGGYTGNTKQGPPGSVTIRRGLERVETIALGIEIGRKM